MSQIARDDVLRILERRFDYQSARNVLERTAKTAKIGGKESFSADELGSFCALLEESNKDVTSIIEAMNEALGGGGGKPAPKKPAPKKEEPAQAKKPAPKKEEPKKEEPKKAPKAEAPKAAPKKDDKKAEASKSASKKDDKKDSKKDKK